jgi:hypothetical protein
MGVVESAATVAHGKGAQHDWNIPKAGVFVDGKRVEVVGDHLGCELVQDARVQVLADLLGSLGSRALLGVHRVSDLLAIGRVGRLEFVDAGEFVEVGDCTEGGVISKDTFAKDATWDAGLERHCCVSGWSVCRGWSHGSV